MRLNIARYSSNERPHGTTWSSVNMNRDPADSARGFVTSRFASGASCPPDISASYRLERATGK